MSAKIRHLLIDDLDRSAGTLTIHRHALTHRTALDEILMHLARTWLIDRAHHWPATRNRHLFLSDHSARRLTPMSRYGITAGFRRIGITATQLRQDRLLDEATHTADPVALITVFGIGVTTAIRYIHAAHPEQLPGDPI